MFFPVCKSFYRPKRLNRKYVDFYTIENESVAISAVKPNVAREEVVYALLAIHIMNDFWVLNKAHIHIHTSACHAAVVQN